MKVSGTHKSTNYHTVMKYPQIIRLSQILGRRVKARKDSPIQPGSLHKNTHIVGCCFRASAPTFPKTLKGIKVGSFSRHTFSFLHQNFLVCLQNLLDLALCFSCCKHHLVHRKVVFLHVMYDRYISSGDSLRHPCLVLFL